MPNEVPMVSSCPLCLAPDEVESMLTVEIERAIPRGRASILICRNCALAVIRAVERCEPPLLSTLIYDTTPPIDPEVWKAGIEQGATQTTYQDAIETLAESAELHRGEEPADGKTTD